MTRRGALGAVGLAVAAMIVFALPLVYTFLEYQHRYEVLDFKARLSAAKVAKFIDGQEKLWQYQSVHFDEVLELPSSAGALRHRVVDSSGKVVFDNGRELAPPVLLSTAPIVVGSTTVGELITEESLDEFVKTVLLCLLASTVLAVAAYMGFRALPLRALDDTIAQLEIQNRRFDIALSNMSQGLCVFDKDRRAGGLQFPLRQPLRPARRSHAAGHVVGGIVRYRLATGRYSGASPQEHARSIDAMVAAGTPSTHVYDMWDGRSIFVKFEPLEGGGWVATHEDITEQRRAEAHIAHLAHHDPLTDLPNRVLLSKRLEEARRRCGRRLGGGAVPRSRSIQGGQRYARPPGRRRPSQGNSQALARVACGRPIRSRGSVVTSSPSCRRVGAAAGRNGTCRAHHRGYYGSHRDRRPPHRGRHQRRHLRCAGDTDDTAQLFKYADMALYQVKGQGRGTYRFFEPAMDALMHERRRWRSTCGRPSGGGFELYYQPIINLARAVSTFEALLRWHQPHRGMVSPGRVHSPGGGDRPDRADRRMGAAARLRAGRHLAGQCPRVRQPVAGAIQASPAGRGGAQALADGGLAADRLELEITESILLESTEETLAVLPRCATRACASPWTISASAFPSLRSLRIFPFDKIKIDRSFVWDLGTRPSLPAIVEAIAMLGARLDMTITAEGVETSDQLAWVRALGVTEVQGFFISRPRPAGDIPDMLGSASLTAREAA